MCKPAIWMRLMPSFALSKDRCAPGPLRIVRPGAMPTTLLNALLLKSSGASRNTVQALISALRRAGSKGHDAEQRERDQAGGIRLRWLFGGENGNGAIVCAKLFDRPSNAY